MTILFQLAIPDTSWAAHRGNGRIEVGTVFDDNIFQDKNSSESDLRWESNLFMAYFLGKGQVSATAIVNRYLEHKALNYEQYEIGFEGPFGSRSYAALFYTFSPTALLDKTEADLEPFAFASRGLGLQIDRDFSRKLNLGLLLSIRQLRYNKAFSAKDSRLLSIGPAAGYQINDAFSISINYTFEAGRAKGGRTADSPIDDTSYNANIASVQLRVLASKRVKIRLAYRIERKRYTSGVDPFHRGRIDFNNRMFLSFNYASSKNIVLRTAIEQTWHFSSDGALDYRGKLVSLSAAYLF